MPKEKESIVRKKSVAQAQVLEERTLHLATPVAKDTYTGQVHRVFVFKASGEELAVASSFVKEVVPIKAYTSIPGAPPILRGLFLLRGQFLPLVDTAMILGLPSLPGNEEKAILIMHSNGVAMGWLVDAYSGIKVLRDDELLMEATIGKGLKKDWVLAMGPEQLTVLNTGKLLADTIAIFTNGTYEKDLILKKTNIDENRTES